MKSQMLLALLLLIIGSFFFQPTYQYRLSKRELTEYDLTNFIVGTCSSDKTDMLIQNLCDQTLQSALMGNFPFLTYYCKTIGAEMSYCNNINQQILIHQNAGAKRFLFRRLVRSLHGNKKLSRKGQGMNIETDLGEKLIMKMCITKPEESSIQTEQFCNRTLQDVQQGQYPEIIRLCKHHPDSDYCRHVQSYSSSFRPLKQSPSSSSSLSSPSSSSAAATHSIKSHIKPSFVSPSVSKLSEIESIIKQHGIDKQK